MRRFSVWLYLGLLWVAAGCGSERGALPPKPAVQDSLAAAGTPTGIARDGAPLIVAFGDSLTAGPRVDPQLNYPSQLQSLLDQGGYSYRVVNAGISGDTTAQGLSRLRNVIEMQPRLVILEFGGNDGLRGLQLAGSRKNLESMIQQLKEAGITVVLAGMRIPPNYGPAYTEEFYRMYADLAARHDVALIPFFLDGVAGKPDLNLGDGIHPNAEGYRLVARLVFENLKPLLQ